MFGECDADYVELCRSEMVNKSQYSERSLHAFPCHSDPFHINTWSWLWIVAVHAVRVGWQ